MLPKSRIVSALVVGLGIALIVAGLAAPMVLNADGRLPLDLKNTTWTVRDDNAVSAPVYDAEAEPEQGPVTHQLHMQIQPPATADDTAVRIGSSWYGGDGTEFEALISAQTWSYIMNRVTGEAESPATLTHTVGMPPVETEVEGHWLKLPSNAEQTTYDVFDETLREARPAVFIDSGDREGREIYHYRQVVEPTNVAELYAGMFNTRVVPTEDGGTEQTYLFHSATRDLYVDQVTGLVVGMDVRVDDYYAHADGTRVDDVLSFEGTMDEEQSAALLEEISGIDGVGQAQMWRWIVVAVGAVVAIVGLIGAFVGRGARRRADSADDADRADDADSAEVAAHGDGREGATGQRHG